MSAARIRSFGCRCRMGGIRCRDAPRDLGPSLLQFSPHRGEAPLEVAFLLLKFQHLGAYPSKLAAQVIDVDDVVAFGFRPARDRRPPSDRDLLMCGPVLLPGGAGIAWPLDARSDLVALLERDRPRDDFPLMGLVFGVRVGEPVADVELLREDRKGGPAAWSTHVKKSEAPARWSAAPRPSTRRDAGGGRR